MLNFSIKRQNSDGLIKDNDSDTGTEKLLMGRVLSEC